MNSTHSISAAEATGYGFIPTIVLIIVSAIVKIIQVYKKKQDQRK